MSRFFLGDSVRAQPSKHNRAASVLNRAVHVLCLVRTAGEHHQFAAAIRLRSS
jgi:hypothetical protein